QFIKRKPGLLWLHSLKRAARALAFNEHDAGKIADDFIAFDVHLALLHPHDYEVRAFAARGEKHALFSFTEGWAASEVKQDAVLFPAKLSDGHRLASGDTTFERALHLEANLGVDLRVIIIPVGAGAHNPALNNVRGE